MARSRLIYTDEQKNLILNDFKEKSLSGEVEGLKHYYDEKINDLDLEKTPSYNAIYKWVRADEKLSVLLADPVVDNTKNKEDDQEEKQEEINKEVNDEEMEIEKRIEELPRNETQNPEHKSNETQVTEVKKKVSNINSTSLIIGVTGLLATSAGLLLYFKKKNKEVNYSDEREREYDRKREEKSDEYYSHTISGF